MFSFKADQGMAKMFLSFASEKKKKFGFPSWMEKECPTCKKKNLAQDIMDMSVNFNPSSSGDFCLSFMCPECLSVFVVHFKANIKSVNDLVTMFALKEPDFEIEYDHVLIQNGRHNVKEAIEKAVNNG